MANALFAAARAYWAARVENRAERIESASRRLAAIAREQSRKAERLRGKRTARSTDRTITYKRETPKSNLTDKPTRPYDWVESGAVNCPMWCDEGKGEFVFGLRWKISDQGRNRYRRTVSVEMFEDVVLALGELSARYAADDRIPVGIRQRMKEYYPYLKVLPNCVDEDSTEATKKRTLGNGVGSTLTEK